jgi:hemolysin activation/secretion protein
MKVYCWMTLFGSISLITPCLTQAANVGVPDAGSLLQQVQPFVPPPFSPLAPQLSIEEEDGSSNSFPSSETLLLQRIRIARNTLFDTPTLLALVEDAQGKRLALSQLADLAARITDYYRDQGYPLTRAIIPPQTIQQGILRIDVIEPRYGKITLFNTSQIRDPLLLDTLSILQSGEFIEESKLDGALLLLSDIAGIVVKPTLKLGAANGTSDLQVSITPGSSVTGHIAVDNHGNSYVGGENISGAVTFNNPLHEGDALTFNVISSGAGMNYERVAYESLINGRGARLGGAYSSLQYKLGGSLATAGASGTAIVTSLSVKQPLLRSRNTNVYGQIQLDRMQLRDHIEKDVPTIHTDRHIESVIFTLYGDFRDEVLFGGVNTWSVGSTFGRIDFDDMTAQTRDAETANTKGNFSKLNSSLSSVQNIGENRELQAVFNAQWTDKNLDSSLKMSGGGSRSVRAYAAGTISGDSGYFLSLKFMQYLGLAWGGQWATVAFIDNARLTLNKNIWPGVTGASGVSLSGTGLGLIWSGPDQWAGTVYIAKPIGPSPSLLGTISPTQFSLEAQKRF